MSAQRPDLFSPLPVGFFRHPKVHRVREIHPHAAEGFLVLIAEAEAQTRRRGKTDPGFVKMLHADFCLCLGIPIDSAVVSTLLTAYETLGWVDIRDGDDLSFDVRLLNFQEWAANKDRSEPNDPKQAAKFSNSPANRHEEISLEEEVEVEEEVDVAKDPARTVFDYWRKKCGHPSARFGQDRVKHIRARLKEGYTVPDLLKAVDGCAASEWHMGKNPQRVQYNELSRIVANSEQVDKFMGMSGKPGTSADDFFSRNGM